MKALSGSYDIVVMGGGPAGAATALRAAQLGHSVCLIERGYGQWHAPFCQSLAPSIWPLLDVLGVRDDVQAQGIRELAGPIALWESALPLQHPHATAEVVNIERRVLDRILQDNAVRAGAALVRAIVIGVERSPQGSMAWRVRLISDGRVREMRARALVDAAGKKPIVATQRSRDSPQLVALLGVWQAAHGTKLQSIVEAGPECWYWAGPQGGGRYTAAVFLDPRSAAFAKGAGVTAVYRALIGRSQLLRNMPGELVAPVVASDATTRHVSNPLQAGLVHVGEAALSLDPLSSQGVQRALTAALQSAVVLNTWLRRPECGAAADAFYRDRHSEAVGRAVENTGRIYAQAAGRFTTRFWAERSVLPDGSSAPRSVSPAMPMPEPWTRLRLANDVRVVRAAVVQGDVAEFAPAVLAPGWRRAVAFARGQPVGQLTYDFVGGTTAADLAQRWAVQIGEVQALQTLAWMWQVGVLAAVGDSRNDCVEQQATVANLRGLGSLG
jgi:flavin-dependent dehydrogenase